MATCQICQHQNPEGADYCENCGAALTASPELTPAAQPAEQPDAPPSTADAASPEPVNATPAPDSTAEVPAPAAEAPALEPASAPAEPAATPAEIPATEPASVPPEAGTNPRLIARRAGGATADEFPLMGDRLVVGRFDVETGPVDIDLSETPEAPQISRHHAELYREADGRWFVKDLGATNGVFVKSQGSASFGPRLTAPQALSSGDEVAFGNARFVFQTD